MYHVSAEYTEEKARNRFTFTHEKLYTKKLYHTHSQTSDAIIAIMVIIVISIMDR